MKNKNSALPGLCGLAAGLLLLAATSASAAVARYFPNELLQSSNAPVTVFSQLPGAVVPADTFNIAIVGFNAANTGAFLVSPLTATFGMTQTFVGAGPGGQTVTVTSSETINGAMTTDTVTISVPTNFVPTGTTIGGTPVTLLEMDLGGYNAGTNTLDFLTPVTSPTYTGSIQYSGGTFALNPTPNTVLTNGNMSLKTAEGVNAGGSDLSPLAIRSFTFTATYATVPEPSSIALGLIGGTGLLLALTVARRRRLA
ncbi:MAG: PEP-CTERM sorting domain-containing protein [Chthoniobacterales bacterium]